MPDPTTIHDLSKLSRSCLERDDVSDPGGRIYRDGRGDVYHSVTRILKETSDSKAILEAWEARLGTELATQERNTAAERGTRTHNAAEYVLRTAKRMAEATAKQRGSLYVSREGLPCSPAPLTRWAISKVLPNAPKVGLSANGYKRSLLGWISKHVTCIHAVEFSVHHPAGFAGTADALLNVDGKGPAIVDFKTSFNRRSEAMLTDYTDQLGAYSLALRHLTGIPSQLGYIVIARRAGPPDIRELSALELRGAEARFLDRCEAYHAKLMGA